MSAASQARRRRGADELEIVAFERGDYTSYSRVRACRTSSAARSTTSTSSSPGRPRSTARNGIDVRMRHEVVAIDLDAAHGRPSRDLDARASEHDEPFDQLVIATGATPIRPDAPGRRRRGVHGVQTLADGIALHDHVGATDPTHARSSSAPATSGSRWPRR